MPHYTVHIVRHIVSYLTASAAVEAPDYETAARIASRQDLVWLDSDQTDESYVDYEVEGENEPTMCWRDDSGMTYDDDPEGAPLTRDTR